VVIIPVLDTYLQVRVLRDIKWGISSGLQPGAITITSYKPTYRYLS